MANSIQQSLFKDPPAGRIPVEWRMTRIKNICNQPVSGQSPICEDRVAGKEEVGVLKLSCIKNGVFDPRENKASKTSTQNILSTHVKAGTLLISRSNTPDLVGAVCYVRKTHENLYLSDLIWELSPRNGKDLHIKWLSYYLWLPMMRRKISSIGNGTSGTMVKITKGSFLHLEIPLPSIAEQKKIAEILTVWDEAIRLQEELIREKEERKRGLMQQLLTGKRRLPGFETKKTVGYRIFTLPADWWCPKMGEVAKERSVRNKAVKSIRVLSCTKYAGFVDSETYFGRKVHSADLSNYKIVRRNWLGFPSNHVEEGSIGLQDSYDEGLVSPIYVVFECGKHVRPDFLMYLFKTDLYRHIFESSTNSSVDRRGSLRWKDFSKIQVPIPSLAEQDAIIDALQDADSEIKLESKKLVELKNQKKGLMQKLLTGQIRT